MEEPDEFDGTAWDCLSYGPVRDAGRLDEITGEHVRGGVAEEGQV
ncbi:hypothetical protein [Actinocorallia sp. A-T 12471]|nr:hypothetical protein [Actinocorallia sp. A-T 12471]MDX6741599.1 hypothetical protein [Actinocorallia sp. A-T 12471]